ncbi:hypothetical protein POF51_26385 [Brevibacillus sp. AG]|uniref:hypothetical protein n=1 Tax=Brevibacillus sp. AG TaxID=3020891 RepID=UPI00232F8447|nr:hypothetical protein [Brevibacillus sp. AG]MDC0764252.1 hypothetical protein [Brevibacillus sp. AG]
MKKAVKALTTTALMLQICLGAILFNPLSVEAQTNPVTQPQDSVGLQAGPAKAVIKEDVKQGDEVRINKLFIQNTGTVREKVVISTEGGITVEKESLILKPQEKVFLEASIQPDFTMMPGKTEGKILISATEDEGKGIQHNPAVELQFNYNLIAGTLADKWMYYVKNNEYVQGSILVALLVILIGLVMRKRKKRTKPQVEVTT